MMMMRDYSVPPLISWWCLCAVCVVCVFLFCVGWYDTYVNLTVCNVSLSEQKEASKAVF
jgi:hypothetical protein